MQAPPLLSFHPVVKLRQTLHQYPELSGAEKLTAERIKDFLTQYAPDQILTNIGGTGLVAVFNGHTPSDGPTVLFRAELDALPIEDVNEISYRSAHPGVGHKCGHDGHMAILAGLAHLLHQQKPERGRVLLLFQPAEETGAGALEMLQDERLQELKPDYVFALHNLPGFPEHQIVVRQDVFAAASTGMIIELEGKSSHAAEPEKGNNPALAVSEIVQAYHRLVHEKEQFQDLALLTVVHVRVGEIAFGTNPGFATVMATLRAFQPADFEKLKTSATETATTIADRHDLKVKISFTEEFSATVNDSEAVDIVKQAAEEAGYPVSEVPAPFRWSEDFGHFTSTYKGALFGLGAGEDQPQLHHPDYDFPDDIIPTGSTLMYTIANKILNQ